MGSVSPLIAVFLEMKKQGNDFEAIWVGTKDGPEKEFIASYDIPYMAISGGKLRRYFSWQNFFDPFFVIIGFFQSLFIVIKQRPSVIVTAGGFISVPLVWAGWLWRVPSLVHQQDVRPGLANILMAPFAKAITVTFEESLRFFSKKKTIQTGNPARSDMLGGDKDSSYGFFNFEKNIPVILILGGGTGASKINQLVFQSLQALVEFCQVIHLTGKGKNEIIAQHARYRVYEFLTSDLNQAFALADLVICRAGMSTLTELSILKKPMIIIPIPGTHQEDNALAYAKNNAAIIFEQNSLTAENFAQKIRNILLDKPSLNNLSRNAGKIMVSNAAALLSEKILAISK